MDDFLRRWGYWPAFLLAFGAGVPFVLVGDEGLYRGLSTALAMPAGAAALRAAALRADHRLGPPPPGWRARARAVLLRWRWVVALLWGALGASAYPKYGSRLWLSALVGVTAFAGAAFATRPFPAAPPRPAPEPMVPRALTGNPYDAP